MGDESKPVPVVANELEPGQKVLVLDAFGKYLTAVVRPVPRHLRDKSGHDGWTSRGDFPKAFVQTRQGGGSVPWPIEDVFWPVASAALYKEETGDG